MQITGNEFWTVTFRLQDARWPNACSDAPNPTFCSAVRALIHRNPKFCSAFSALMPQSQVLQIFQGTDAQKCHAPMFCCVFSAMTVNNPIFCNVFSALMKNAKFLQRLQCNDGLKSHVLQRFQMPNFCSVLQKYLPASMHMHHEMGYGG